MEIAPTQLSQPSPSTAQTSASSEPTLDYQSFMRLLLAQLQNQDPTNPADPTEFTAQLATLSSVEQSIETNKKLENLLSAMSIGQSDGLIGRTVTSSDGETSGLVSSVTIASDGSSHATLEDGRTVAIGPGITVS